MQEPNPPAKKVTGSSKPLQIDLKNFTLKNATIRRVLSTWRCMRNGKVSIPCRIWNAVIGAMQAPKSRIPSRRARSRNAAVANYSVNTMS